MRGANLLGSRKYHDETGLFFKFQGSEPIIQSSAEKLQEIVKGFGGNNWEFAKDKADAEELWMDRKMHIISDSV